MFNEGDEIPKALKLVMMFIDRVGFPIVAFFIMSGFCIFVLTRVVTAVDKISGSLDRNTDVLVAIRAELQTRPDVTDEGRRFRKRDRIGG